MYIYSKVSSEFLRQDSQSSCSFDKIQNVGDLELSEEKTYIYIYICIYVFFVVVVAVVS